MKQTSIFNRSKKKGFFHLFPSNTILLLSIAVAGSISCSKNDEKEQETVAQSIEMTIHNTKFSSGYMGNGVEFSMYEVCDDAQSDWGRAFGMYMDNAMWNKTFERLDFMKLGLVRTMISSKGFCYRGKDASGNPIINNAYKADLVDRWLGYCDRNDITVLWGEWGTGTIVNTIREPLWSNTIIDYADYLINTRNHKSLKYFIGVNEPDGNWTEATNANFGLWEIATNNVYSRIQEKGIGSQLQIAGPDACPGITGTSFIEKTTGSLKDKIGLWNIHIYPYPDQIRSGSYEALIKQWHKILGTEKKLVLGEVGMKYKQGTPESIENITRAVNDPMGKSDINGGSNMFVYDFFYAIDIADLYIQCMRGGISGGCSWIVCDAMNTSPNQKMHRWGFWNIFGTKMGNPADENIRPWFYTVSLLSRYIPVGSDILAVDASNVEGVRAVAATLNGEISIAVVNNSKKAQQVTFKMAGENPRQVKKYTCFENSRPVDAKQLPVPKETKTMDLSAGETIDLPPVSFVLLTSFNF